MRVSLQGIPPEEMRAIRAELKGDGTELDGQKFDVIVVSKSFADRPVLHADIPQCAASYHHIVDIDSITRILASFLKPGGSLLVADILKDSDGQEKGELLQHFRHVVPHSGGFTETEARSNFEQAGLRNIECAKIPMKVKLHGQDVDFFLARGMLS